MANYTSMQQLIEDSVQVTEGMTVVYSQSSKEEKVDYVMKSIPKFNGRYATKNSTVAFIYDGKFFVTPYTIFVVRALRANGLKEEDFSVPFSKYDYPKGEREKWEALWDRAIRSRKDNFRTDCIAFCEQHNIDTISEKILNNCFEMPEEGVEVKHPYYEDCYYPIVRGNYFDCIAAERLGTYCTNNGKVVFVYIDGRTYVTKGYKIVSELIKAGYREAPLFVPFSNGEEIKDETLRKKWESITK